MSVIFTSNIFNYKTLVFIILYVWCLDNVALAAGVILGVLFLVGFILLIVYLVRYLLLGIICHITVVNAVGRCDCQFVYWADKGVKKTTRKQKEIKNCGD